MPGRRRVREKRSRGSRLAPPGPLGAGRRPSRRPSRRPGWPTLIPLRSQQPPRVPVAPAPTAQGTARDPEKGDLAAKRGTARQVWEGRESSPQPATCVDFVLARPGPGPVLGRRRLGDCGCRSCQMAGPPGRSPSPASHGTVELCIYSRKHRYVYIPSTDRALASCWRCLSQKLPGALPPAGSLAQTRDSTPGASGAPALARLLRTPRPAGNPPHGKSAPCRHFTRHICNMALWLFSSSGRQAPKADSMPSMNAVHTCVLSGYYGPGTELGTQIQSLERNGQAHGGGAWWQRLALKRRRAGHGGGCSGRAFQKQRGWGGESGRPRRAQESGLPSELESGFTASSCRYLG